MSSESHYGPDDFGGSDFPTDFEQDLRQVVLEKIQRREEAALMASREAIGNGVQQGFASGATRSSSEGKIDYEGHLSPDVLAVFGAYMNRHRIQRDGQLRASDNWQEGIPIPNYVKSLVRHTFEFWRMWRGQEVPNPDANNAPFTFEDVLSAIMFNVMGIVFELSRPAASGFLKATYCTKQFRQHLEKAGTAKDPHEFEKLCETNRRQTLVPDDLKQNILDAQTDMKAQRLTGGR